MVCTWSRRTSMRRVSLERPGFLSLAVDGLGEGKAGPMPCACPAGTTPIARPRPARRTGVGEYRRPARRPGPRPDGDSKSATAAPAADLAMVAGRQAGAAAVGLRSGALPRQPVGPDGPERPRCGCRRSCTFRIKVRCGSRRPARSRSRWLATRVAASNGLRPRTTSSRSRFPPLPNRGRGWSTAAKSRRSIRRWGSGKRPRRSAAFIVTG